jgi:two-component system, chemotaxis family, sensor kinase CheA
MPIDLRQFHQTFFDESQEGLASMESALLEMESHDGQTTDPDALNSIFRVVHSIKGGSGTFSFGWLADFSHTLETFLEPLRTGQRRIDRAVAGLLLRAVDCLRSLLASARSGKPVNKAAIEEVYAELEALQQDSHAPVKAGATPPPAHSAAMQRWHIRFIPKTSLFESGNDPLRILRELAELGALQVRSDLSRLPSWDDFDPEKCYLGWDLELTAACALETIQEVFAWVVDDCELNIEALDSAPVPATTAAFAEVAAGQVRAHGTSIRVSTGKMDALVDIVGELVITQTILNQTVTQFGPDSLPRLTAGLAQLERNLRQLQEDVMRIRMLPIGFIFSRLPRLVRDVGEQLGKQVNLRIGGEATELDKSVIERISDPILHMVRNSLDHGIESPAERLAAGKPETGQIRLEAHQRGGNVIIEIEDDGRGLALGRILARAIERGLVPAGTDLTPEQASELIFQPGFTTTDSVSELSGRGVGLDVVRNNIYALGGNVDIDSQVGRGTRFTIRMPLTLAILDGLGVQVGQQTYIVPLANITESLRPTSANVHRLPGGEEILAFRQEHIPLIRMAQLFHTAARDHDTQQDIIVVVEANGRHAGLIVHDLLGQQQVVIKSLDSHYRRVDGIAAATIMGDGTVAFILDVASLVRRTSAATRGVDGDDPAGGHRHASPPPRAALH